MLSRLIYSTAISFIAINGHFVNAGKNKAWLYSGTVDECTNSWDYEKALSQNMDKDKCITGQPTSDGRRQTVYVPRMRTAENDTEKKYCLIMSIEDGCPEEANECMVGTYKQDITVYNNITDQGCVALNYTGVDDGALSFKSFKFKEDTTCESWQAKCDNFSA